VLIQAYLSTEGDHIKVTASKYPFPTVCADKQSTDWFHAISRTLKWNERERQKSFVVVEEDPDKPKRRKKRGTGATEQAADSDATVERVEPILSDEEEDEVSDEEEDDKFDIDDSAAESDATTNAPSSVSEQSTLRPPGTAKDFARKRRAKSRSKSRQRSTSATSHFSGVDSPSRYASPQPHSTKHVDFNYPSSNDSSPTHAVAGAGQADARDEVQQQKSPSLKSKIPRDREIGVETPRTATQPFNAGHGRGRGQSVTRGQDGTRRAFAVYGQDESDSNASDSDL
jgi:NAD+ kinase